MNFDNRIAKLNQESANSFEGMTENNSPRKRRLQLLFLFATLKG